ncbi:MAG: RNA polymerase sigma-I factor [Clostridium sp.]|nr:RNA polymerase sigma-I factor [Clostridium sp.]
MINSLSPESKGNTPKATAFGGDVTQIIKNIKGGDISLRNEFINNYMPYIIKITSSVIGGFVDIKNSDEFSVGLCAFNEAIDSFNEQKNPHFLKFATLVMKRRLIDYARNEKKHCNVYPFTYFEDDEGNYQDHIMPRSEDDVESRYEIAREIELFEEKLRESGINFEDLVNASPKHRDSKSLCISIARVIANDKELFNRLSDTGNLPKTRLLEVVKVNKKTIERNRAFIIAASIILGYDFHLLKDFLDIGEFGGGDIELRKK